MSDQFDDDQTQSYVPLTKGTMVSHYRIADKIGAGGMGEVYLAEDTNLKRHVALKFLPSRLAAEPDFNARFVREAEATAQLNHPNIVTIYEVGEYQGQPFFAMELMEGQSLQEIGKGKELGIERITELALQICEGLSAAHEKKIVHRDIKPSNIVVDAYGRPKILDFGLAAVKGSEHLTKTGSTLGTIRYMSPEQVEGKKVDQRSDLFSFGVVLYELIAGRTPFEREGDMATGQATINVDPEPLARYRANIPEELQRAVSKLLEKDPDLRYQSASEVIADLKRLTASSQSTALATGGHPTGLRRWLLPISALVIVLVAVLVLKPWRFEVSAKHDAQAAENALAVLSFENLQDSTDEERYGQILQDLIITDLSGLSSVRVLSRQRLQDIGRQLGLKKRGKIALSSGSEIAREAGAHSMLAGNIMRRGDEWILTCQLIDVATGTVLRSHRVDGSDLYAMVDDLSDSVRLDLNLPVFVGDAVGQRVAEKTTTSMEAYRYYLAGLESIDESRFRQAIAEMDSAIAVDPGFVRAYIKRGMAYGWIYDIPKKEHYAPLAKILEEKQYASELERQQLEGTLAILDMRLVDALRIFKRLTTEYPDDKEAWYGLGEAYYHESNLHTSDALDAFRRAIDLDMTFIIAYRHLMHYLAQTKNHEEALEHANHLVKLRPNSSIGYRYLVQAYIVKGDSVEIAMAFKQALEHHQTDEELAGLFYEMSIAYRWADRDTESEEYARLALEHDPEDHKLYGALGNALTGQEKLVEAKQSFERGLDFTPHSSTCLSGLIGLAREEEDYERGIELMHRYMTISSPNATDYRYLARMYFWNKQFEQADSVIESGLAALPTLAFRVELAVIIGEFYQQNNNRNRAKQLYRHAIEIDTAGLSSKPGRQLATMFNGERRFEQAERMARQALEVHPKSWQASYQLIIALTALEKHDQAIALGRELVERWPKNWGVHLRLIRALGAARRFEDTEVALEVAMNLDTVAKTKASLLWETAFAYWKVDSLDRCVRYAERGLEIFPEHKGIHKDLGTWYSMLGQYDLAQARLERLLEIDSTYLWLYQRMGINFLRQGRLVEAESSMLKLQELNSTAWAHRMYFYVLAHQERWEEALLVAEEALAKDSGFFCHMVLSWALVSGDLDVNRGLELAHKTLTLRNYPTATDRWIWQNRYIQLPEHSLGIGYLKTGKYEKAREYLEQAAVLRPDDETIARDLRMARDRLGG